MTQSAHERVIFVVNNASAARVPKPLSLVNDWFDGLMLEWFSGCRRADPSTQKCWVGLKSFTMLRYIGFATRGCFDHGCGL